MIEHAHRFLIRQKRTCLIKFFLVGGIKGRVKQIVAKNGHVGSVKLALARNAQNVLHDVGQGRGKREQHDHVVGTVLFLGFGIRQHALAVEGMTAHKAVAGKKVLDDNALGIRHSEDLVRAVAHAVHDHVFICMSEIFPQIGICGIWHKISFL